MTERRPEDPVTGPSTPGSGSDVDPLTAPLAGVEPSAAEVTARRVTPPAPAEDAAALDAATPERSMPDPVPPPATPVTSPDDPAAPGRTGTTPPVTADTTATDTTATDATATDTTADTAPGAGTVTADDEPAAPAAQGAGRGLLIGMIALTVVGLIATGVLAFLLYQRDREDDRREQALDAATQLATNLTSYDSDSLDEDFQRVEDRAMGDFAKDFAKQSATVRTTIEQFDVNAEGEVREAAVQELSRDGRMATVLLFVDQKVRTSEEPTARTDKNRLVMTVQRVGGKWFVSRVRVL